MTAGFVVLIFFLLLPPVYFLSIGPAFWLLQHEYVSGSLYVDYTAPGRVVLSRCQPLNEAMNWYLRLWATGSDEEV